MILDDERRLAQNNGRGERHDCGLSSMSALLTMTKVFVSICKLQFCWTAVLTVCLHAAVWVVAAVVFALSTYESIDKCAASVCN